MEDLGLGHWLVVGVAQQGVLKLGVLWMFDPWPSKTAWCCCLKWGPLVGSDPLGALEYLDIFWQYSPFLVVLSSVRIIKNFSKFVYLFSLAILFPYDYWLVLMKKRNIYCHKQFISYTLLDIRVQECSEMSKSDLKGPSSAGFNVPNLTHMIPIKFIPKHLRKQGNI